MSSSDYREPSNDELWSQPPMSAASGERAPISVPNSAPLATTADQRGRAQQMPVAGHARPDRTVLTLAIVSLVMGIPLTAIGSDTAGLPGLLVVWVGIVLVNIVYARGRGKQP